MIHFRRIFQYIFPQYKAIILSVVCALLVAILFTLSIGAMLPMMRVMMEEEGLHGWVNRAIIKDRSGITFYMVGPPKFINAGLDDDRKAIPLRIKQVARAKSAGAIKIGVDDVIVAVDNEDFKDNPAFSHDKLLEKIAKGQKEIKLRIENLDRTFKTVTVPLDSSPFYAELAWWMLDFVPREQSPVFKRNCLILIISILLVSTILRCLARFLQEYLVRCVAVSSVMMLRNDTYKQAIRMPLNFFSQEGISDSMSRILQDTNQIRSGITTVFGKAIREPLKMVSFAIGAYVIDAQMTTIVLLGAPVAGVLISKLGKKMKKATRRALESRSDVLGHLHGTLLGIRIVKGYHQEERESTEFMRHNNRLYEQQIRMEKINAGSGPILEGLGVTAACIGMIFAAHWMTGGEERMATSDFFTLVGMLAVMAESGRKLGDVYPRLQTANASAERVYKLYDGVIEHDPLNGKVLARTTQSVEMRNVSFTYPNSEKKTLDSIDLKVQAGEVVAVVGPNGSGKTTLLSMIPKFFVPSEGQVLIDGQDISGVTLESLRRQIGIVTQQTTVFNDTIAVNIAYGKPDATDDEIRKAAQKAYADDFIENTTNGYNTIIGEQGATLSGGQLQRIAIARAILLDPAILIFDEAMSQIDSDSEAKIQKALEEFSQGRTSFIIAHRLSTIINSDRIIVMDEGKIVAQGKHKELLASSGLYKKLYEMQFAG
ncbi:MAG: ABC transporter ATP-binding protein/permease [Phycisphaerae bacterium]|nr:ABC transporter ATP-binding protein/permease [Phycisphaerae bacterium]